MHKKYCDICKAEVGNLSPGQDEPRGILENKSDLFPKVSAKYLYVQDGNKIEYGTISRDYIGMVCSNCYEKILKFMKELRDE